MTQEPVWIFAINTHRLSEAFLPYKARSQFAQEEAYVLFSTMAVF